MKHILILIAATAMVAGCSTTRHDNAGAVGNDVMTEQESDHSSVMTPRPGDARDFGATGSGITIAPGSRNTAP